MQAQTAPRSSDASDWSDVALTLLLVQAASALVAALGFIAVTLFMGTLPAFSGYALLAVGKPLLLIGLAPGAARGRRRRRRAVLVIECLTLLGFAFNLLRDAVPWLGTAVTFVSLLTNVALPAAIIVALSRRLPAAKSGGTIQSGTGA